MKAVVSYVRDGSTVCDIGTDHAIVPIELIKSGKSKAALITDISLSSLKKGLANAKKAALSDKIKGYHTNGTLGVDLSEVSDFIIAGMGGELIASILEQDTRLKNPNFCFILQPMTKAEKLRIYLSQNGFYTQEEKTIKSNGKIYFVMTVIYTGEKYALSLEEMMLGRNTVRNQNPVHGGDGEVFYEYVRKTYRNLKNIYEEIEKSQNPVLDKHKQDVLNRILVLEKLLNNPN